MAAVAAAQVSDLREIANHPAELAALASDPHRAWLLRGVQVESLGPSDLEVREVAVFDPSARVIINDGRANGPSCRRRRVTCAAASATCAVRWPR